ncbi:MAG TPA: zinc ABC transporter substrate-binding protein [Candidatus Pullichristensenella stercoripullorum]|nr:zinc ABC transporter substrate-binding protein [Candidatus Pullichristensenella stercoripullorum]
MRKYASLLLALCLLLTACSAGAESGGEPLRVVATDFPCYDLARQVLGSDASLTLLIRPGMDTHTYEPTPADAKAVYEADVLIYIGGTSDAWVEDMLADAPGVAAVRMMDSVQPLEEAHAEHGHEDISYDEHIWTSPVNMRAMLSSVEEALCAADPDGASTYRANAEAYDAQLVQLDQTFRDLVSGAARTELIFADRFPFLYFAREYGLSYVSAFSGCSEEAQPSVQAVAALIDAVEKDGVPVIYVIEMSTGDVARAVAEQTGAEIVEMHSCQSVTGEEFEAGETYLSLMTRNVEALRKGLY